MSTTPKEVKRAKAAMDLAKKLEAASKAMNHFVHACADCGEPYPNAGDTRRTLPVLMNEYSGWLGRAYPTTTESNKP